MLFNVSSLLLFGLTELAYKFSIKLKCASGFQHGKIRGIYYALHVNWTLICCHIPLDLIKDSTYILYNSDFEDGRIKLFIGTP